MVGCLRRDKIQTTIIICAIDEKRSPIRDEKTNPIRQIKHRSRAVTTATKVETDTAAAQREILFCSCTVQENNYNNMMRKLKTRL